MKIAIIIFLALAVVFNVCTIGWFMFGEFILDNIQIRMDTNAWIHVISSGISLFLTFLAFVEIGRGRKPPLYLNILVLLFVSLIAGIILLCSRNEDY